MESFYTYILKCSDDSYYVGHTDNIEQRISQHVTGEFMCYTTTRRPVEVVWVQDFGTRDEAFNAERSIKNWSRKKKEALIAGDFNLLSYFAKKKFKDIPPSILFPRENSLGKNSGRADIVVIKKMEKADE